MAGDRSIGLAQVNKRRGGVNALVHRVIEDKPTLPVNESVNSGGGGLGIDRANHIAARSTGVNGDGDVI